MASLWPSVLFNGQRSQVCQDMVLPHTTPGCLLGLVVLLNSSFQNRRISNFLPVLERDDPFHFTEEMLKKGNALGQDLFIMVVRGREHWDVLELTVLQALTCLGNSSFSKTHPVPAKTIHRLMSEVCHGLGKEIGQLSASAVSPVPETEMGFNGEQSATVFSTWLFDTLEPGANYPPICARITALVAAREGCRVPEAWQTEGR